ncbi:hypothetical protein [Streptomyces sp. NBC_01304]|uniref:hypothetical protein n=1 Tax=Streptomyces sp. NBC_01304 TaxID=2903818 RepID=UPI002E14DE20|nr:hypothetical protein OG430_21895 [Streptomyces sp. NBC_01304]
MNKALREVVSIVGWIVGVQGALGAVGRLTTGNDWGLVHKWFDPPIALYVVMAVAGFCLAAYGESARQKAKG